MGVRYPIGRCDLHIKRKDHVLEIGSGHNPMYRSNVLTDKFTSDNSHRCGEICIFPHQRFITAEGEHLPFKEKEFDYVVCNQVLEHAEDPAQFITEITRVGKRGYIETPSMLGELMFPKESHKWVILLLDGKLIFFEKSRMPGNYQNNYGELFLNYLPYQSLPYKLLTFSEPNLLINRIEWDGTLDFEVNPTDPYYNAFFTHKWNREMTVKVFPPRNGFVEICRTIYASFYIAKEKFGQKFRKNKYPMKLSEYEKIQTSKR